MSFDQTILNDHVAESLSDEKTHPTKRRLEMNEISEQVKELQVAVSAQTKEVSDLKKTISEISRINLFDLDDSVKIREELGIDSIMAIEIIAKCERRFNIKIDETKLDSVQTMGDFINFVVSITEKK